ncbi:MAG: hypothetical protein M0P49_03605 [Bacilli bacterium]|nr:hypothetical protein [Bacilli bacterium]
MNIEFTGYRRVVYYKPTVVKNGGAYRYTITENRTIKKVYDITLIEITDAEDPQLVPGRDLVKILGEWVGIDGVGYDTVRKVKIYRVDYTGGVPDSEDPLSRVELEDIKERLRFMINQL